MSLRNPNGSGHMLQQPERCGPKLGCRPSRLKFRPSRYKLGCAIMAPRSRLAIGRYTLGGGCSEEGASIQLRFAQLRPSLRQIAVQSDFTQVPWHCVHGHACGVTPASGGRCASACVAHAPESSMSWGCRQSEVSFCCRCWGRRAALSVASWQRCAQPDSLHTSLGLLYLFRDSGAVASHVGTRDLLDDLLVQPSRAGVIQRGPLGGFFDDSSGQQPSSCSRRPWVGHRTGC